MSPITITPINSLITKKSTLSNYAQKYLISQAKSISFTLERFFMETDAEILSKKEQKLREIGITAIGKDIKEGIIISGKKCDYHIFSPENNILSFNALKPDSNQVYQHFSLNSQKNEYTHAGDFNGKNLEDAISEILDFADNIIYKAKKECTQSEITDFYLPIEKASDKIAEYRKKIYRTSKNTDINNSALISLNEKELIHKIPEKFSIMQNLYKKVSNSKTKYKMRSSYSNYMPQPVANKIGFKNAGPNNESLSLFFTSYRNNSHAAIGVTDTKGKHINFVISTEKGTVQKNLPSKYTKSEYSDYRICLTPEYYTQKEIEDLNFKIYLECLNKEMDSFIEHTQNLFKRKEDIRLIRANNDTAALEHYKDIMENIYNEFKDYKKKMRSFLYKTPQSKKFKNENNISTKFASTAVKFDNITPEGYDLRLSYPKVHDKTATQIIVMQGDKIEKSFYIMNNKLVRFNIKDLNDKFRHDNRHIYYYDSKYIMESNLEKYLILLRDKLQDVNKKLNTIRKKQIENRKIYHIKPSKKINKD